MNLQKLEVVVEVRIEAKKEEETMMVGPQNQMMARQIIEVKEKSATINTKMIRSQNGTN